MLPVRLEQNKKFTAFGGKTLEATFKTMLWFEAVEGGRPHMSAEFFVSSEIPFDLVVGSLDMKRLGFSLAYTMGLVAQKQSPGT